MILLNTFRTNKPQFTGPIVHIFLDVPNDLGAKVGTLGRQNKRNSSYVMLAHTSIFGLCFMLVCLMKANCKWDHIIVLFVDGILSYHSCRFLCTILYLNNFWMSLLVLVIIKGHSHIQIIWDNGFKQNKTKQIICLHLFIKYKISSRPEMN